jgi:hypothetical protein
MSSHSAREWRAKFRAGLRQTPWASQVKSHAWAKPWVVDCRPVGSGASALKYLAPYIFRIALSNNRIEQIANDTVTFRYTESKTGAQKRATLPMDTFIGRFLAHVLPKGFVKVRYYGLLHPSQRQLLTEARSLLALHPAVPPRPRAAAAPEPLVTAPDVEHCPSCGQPMQLVQTLPPKRQQVRLVAMVGEPSSRGPPHSEGQWATCKELSRFARRTWLLVCQVGTLTSATELAVLPVVCSRQQADARIRVPAA